MVECDVVVMYCFLSLFSCDFADFADLLNLIARRMATRMDSSPTMADMTISMVLITFDFEN